MFPSYSPTTILCMSKGHPVHSVELTRLGAFTLSHVCIILQPCWLSLFHIIHPYSLYKVYIQATLPTWGRIAIHKAS